MWRKSRFKILFSGISSSHPWRGGSVLQGHSKKFHEIQPVSACNGFDVNEYAQQDLRSLGYPNNIYGLIFLPLNQHRFLQIRKCGSQLNGDAASEEGLQSKLRIDAAERKRELRDELKQRQKQEIKERKKREQEEKLAKLPKTDEEKIIFSIQKAKQKVLEREKALEKYVLPDSIPGGHDPEILTAEMYHYYRKIGKKNKNYLLVGRRGIYGGTIENLHMHWKKHETCRVDCHMFPMDQITYMAQELATLSGGIVIDILRDRTIIMYRGRNYQFPDDLIPKNLLDKRKALKKSLLLQSRSSLLRHIRSLEEQLKQLHFQKQLKGESCDYNSFNFTQPADQAHAFDSNSESDDTADWNSDEDKDMDSESDTSDESGMLEGDFKENIYDIFASEDSDEGTDDLC